MKYKNMYRAKCFCNSKHTYLWGCGLSELFKKLNQCFKSFYE